MLLTENKIKIFKALAHPVRIEIIKILSKEKQCVCQLREIIALSQPNLSQHLKILKEAEIVICEKDGMRVNYSIRNKKILQVLDAVKEIIAENLKDEG